MSKSNNNSGLQGTRLPPIKNNGAKLLEKEYRDRLIAVANALCNLEIFAPATDGANILSAKKARIDISELSMRIIMPATGAAVPGGWQFQSPKIELDPTVAIATQTVVYISTNNPLALGAYTDAVSGTIISSRTGWWVAVKNVPAAVLKTYNVPQLPYPGATGGSYGSHPWTGDLDGANVFWMFGGQSPNC